MLLHDHCNSDEISVNTGSKCQCLHLAVISSDDATFQSQRRMHLTVLVMARHGFVKSAMLVTASSLVTIAEQCSGFLRFIEVCTYWAAQLIFCSQQWPLQWVDVIDLALCPRFCAFH